MPQYHDLPHILSVPDLNNTDANLIWSGLDHLIPSVERGSFDRLGLYLALFLSGGYIQLVDVTCNNLVPQSLIQLPENARGGWCCLSLTWSYDAKHLVGCFADKKTKSQPFVFVWDVVKLTLSNAFQSAVSIVSFMLLSDLPSSLLAVCSQYPHSLISLLDFNTGEMRFLVRERGGVGLSPLLSLTGVEVDKLTPPSLSSPPLSSPLPPAPILLPHNAFRVKAVAVEGQGVWVAYEEGAETGGERGGGGGVQLEHLSLPSLLSPSSSLAPSSFPPLLLPIEVRGEVVLRAEGGRVLCLSPLGGRLCLLSLPSLSITSLPFPTLPFSYLYLDATLPPQGGPSLYLQQLQRGKGPGGTGAGGGDAVLLLSLSPDSPPFPTSPFVVTRFPHLLLRSLLFQPPSPSTPSSSSPLSPPPLVLGLEPGGGLRLSPSLLRSDFAGAMYPLGYSLLPRTVTYFEREDELDLLPPLCSPSLPVAASPATPPKEVRWSYERERGCSLLLPPDYLPFLPYCPQEQSRRGLRRGVKRSREGGRVLPLPLPLPRSLPLPPLPSTDPEGGEEEGAREGGEAGEGTERGTVTTHSNNTFLPLSSPSLQSFYLPPKRIVAGDFSLSWKRRQGKGEVIASLLTDEREVRERFAHYAEQFSAQLVKDTVWKMKKQKLKEEKKREVEKGKERAMQSLLLSMKEREERRKVEERERRETTAMEREERKSREREAKEKEEREGQAKERGEEEVKEEREERGEGALDTGEREVAQILAHMVQEVGARGVAHAEGERAGQESSAEREGGERHAMEVEEREEGGHGDGGKPMEKDEGKE